MAPALLLSGSLPLPLTPLPPFLPSPTTPSLPHPQLKVTDAAVRDGLAKKGISVTAEKKKAFKVVYVVDDDAPTVTLHTSSDISDKTINLKYEHAAKSGKSAVEAEVAVDDKHTGEGWGVGIRPSASCNPPSRVLAADLRASIPLGPYSSCCFPPPKPISCFNSHRRLRHHRLHPQLQEGHP